MPKKHRYLDEVPSGGFLRNYYRARHSDSYDDRARASEKAMLTIQGAAHTDNREMYDKLLNLAGPMQNSFLLTEADKDRYMLSHGYIKGTPGDYGLVRKAVGKRNLPVYQTSTDDIDRQYLVPIGNNMINSDWSEEDWRADRKAELKHPGSYPIAIYMDGRNPNDLYEKAWDLNDYKSGILNIMGYPAVQTTGYKRIPNERYNDLGYSRGPDYKDMRNNYLKTHGLEWNEIISQPSLPVVQVRARRLKDGGRIYIKPENRGKFTALKERTGHSASWFKENGTPAQKKMAVFALNSKKWKH